ncbi:hypothetical protein EVAR_67976_1, partial [Eumeta japonica]
YFWFQVVYTSLFIRGNENFYPILRSNLRPTRGGRCMSFQIFRVRLTRERAHFTGRANLLFVTAPLTALVDDPQPASGQRGGHTLKTRKERAPE